MDVIELDGEKYVLVKGASGEDDCIGCAFDREGSGNINARCCTPDTFECHAKVGTIWARVA